MDVFVARQPIFNKDLEVIGYELLYRDSDKNFFNESITSNVATAILLMNTYFHFGITNLVGDSVAFINFGEHLIMNEIPQLLSTKNVVIEILEDIQPTPKILEKFNRLRRDGYTIAVDDYILEQPRKEILPYCQIMKVDFMHNTKDEIRQIVYKYKKQGKLFLAEKVETKEAFEWAKSLGFDYYQGYFFARPSIVKSTDLSVSAGQYVRLLEALYKPEPDYKEIAKIIEIDVILTFKLLHIVNSNFSLGTQINSIHHALSILGIDAFTKWLSLAMVQNLGKVSSSELVKVAMVRSKMLELMSFRSSILKGHEDELSLLGILSVIDVLLQEPMESVIKKLPLSTEIKKTFLREESLFLYPFELCLAYERGDFGHIGSYTEDLSIHVQELAEDYINAVAWADNLFAYMEDIK